MNFLWNHNSPDIYSNFCLLPLASQEGRDIEFFLSLGLQRGINLFRDCGCPSPNISVQLEHLVKRVGEDIWCTVPLQAEPPSQSSSPAGSTGKLLAKISAGGPWFCQYAIYSSSVSTGEQSLQTEETHHYHQGFFINYCLFWSGQGTASAHWQWKR